MAAPESKGPGFPVAIVGTVLIALAGVIVGHWQLTGTRPPANEIGSDRPGSLQDIPGRLWQDPFAAIDQYMKRSKDAPPDLDPALLRTGPQRLRELRQKLQQGTTASDILGVMVFGGDLPEYAEHRRRTRYAVVSALSSEGFVPDREEALGYFKPEAGVRRQTRVPFEWFGLPDQARRVLLLWLDESVLEGETAVSQLADLMTSLSPSSPQLRARIAILGPVGSGTLRSVNADLMKRKGVPLDMTFYSTATVAPQRLGDQQHYSIRRTIGTDDKVMTALVEELKRRNVDATNSKGLTRIVLLSEWDTLYGRELPREFEAAVCAAKKAEGGKCQASSGAGQRAPWVLHFSYLRGLDGQIPGGSQPDQKRDGDKGKSDPSRPQEPIERAEGHSQFDYVRRLALYVQEFAPGGRDGEARARIAAIGVLGSDVYDKSLVLQAFRKEFPKAEFFTTDLDARLLHPTEYNWTRNLVVASGFGLALHRHLQREIPPFRDSYQTATYLATQSALVNAGRPPGQRLSQDAVDAMVPPRLFEIARGDAFDLSGETPTGIHPQVPRVLPSPTARGVLTGMGIFFSGFFLLYLASPRLMHVVDRLARDMLGASWRKQVAAGVVMFLSAVLIVTAGISVWQEGQRGEPFLLSSGISLWPTEAIRLVAAALSACFLVAVRRAAKRVRERLETEFGRIQAPDPVWPSPWTWLKGIWPALRDRGSETRLAPGERHKFKALWDAYLEQASFPSQCQRVIPATLLFLLFCALIMSFDFPQSPARGMSALRVDRVSLWLCVPLLAWLIVAVSDTIRLVGKYTDLLGEWEPTRWPEHIAKEASKWLGIELRQEGPQEKVKERCVSHWLDIKVIEMWTEVVSPIIYYPFAVLCLLILARSPLFDNWGTPYPLMIVFGLSGLYAAACAFKLRHVAERARSRALDRFTYLLVNAKGEGGSAPLAAQIDIMVKDIQSLRRGAFAPFTEQPVVRALLLPISSAGGMTVFHYLGWGEW